MSYRSSKRNGMAVPLASNLGAWTASNREGPGLVVRSAMSSRWQRGTKAPAPRRHYGFDNFVRYREAKAATVIPGQRGSVALTEMPEPDEDDGPVLVETKAIGVSAAPTWRS